MADFDIAYKATLNNEGGYANNPKDTGGETYKGISRKWHPTWKGWPIIDGIKKKVGNTAKAINTEASKDSGLQILVKAFFKDNFWDAMNLTQINDQRVSNELFDTGVNMSIDQAGIFFQRVLNAVSTIKLKPDGVIGSNTIKAFNPLSNSDKYLVWKFINCLQGSRYISIYENDPSQKIFIRSWGSRVFEINNNT
jgi:Putative secretion activating protein